MSDSLAPRQAKTAGILSLTAAVSAIIILSGCANSDGNTGVEAKPETTSGTTATNIDSSSISELPAKTTAGTSSDLDAPSKRAAPAPGSCGNLVKADGSTYRFDPAGCGEASAYRVTQVVSMPNECPKDSDQVSYRGEAAKGTFYAVCLDIDWRPKKCVSTAGEVATVGPCRPGDETFVQPVRVLFEQTSVERCGEKARGISHPVRRFVVCVA
jgi:outer membrane murein-binding lipoprotein Lpp